MNPLNRVRHETWTSLMTGVYMALMTNLLVVLAALPFVVLLMTTDPARSWPALAVVAPLCAPATAAACRVFTRFSDDGQVTVVRTFITGWRTTARRALPLGAAASAALVVLAVDIRVLSSSRPGAIVIPMLLVLAVLVIAVTLHALVLLTDRPDTRLRDALRLCLWAAVRRWYLTALSLLALGLLLGVTAAHPALGLGLALSPLVYMAWANCRFALRSTSESPAHHLTHRPGAAVPQNQNQNQNRAQVQV